MNEIDQLSNILRQQTNSRGVAFSRIAEHIDATVYRPLLAALQQRVKELEAKVEEVCADNLQRGNRISVEQQIVDLNESQDDLEAENARLKEELRQ